MTPTIKNDLTIYDTVAAQWWSDEVHWVRTLKRMVPARLRYFSREIEWSGQRVLDLGCAGGFMAEAIDDAGASVAGIDPAREAIAAAEAHARETGRTIDYSVGVGEALPYPDQSFDTVVCVDVLEHVAELDTVIAEIARVLKPGGRLAFDTINRNWLASFVVVTMAENIIRLLPKGTHDPAKFILPSELRTLLTQHGLTPGRFAGLGPVGMTLKGDFIFGHLPLQAVIYMGTAERLPASSPAA